MKSRSVQNTHSLLLELGLACALISAGAVAGSAVGWQMGLAANAVPPLIAGLAGGSACALLLSAAVVLWFRQRLALALRALLHQFTAPDLYDVPAALEISPLREVARLWHGFQEFHAAHARISTVVVPSTEEGVEASLNDQKLQGIPKAHEPGAINKNSQEQEKHSGNDTRPPAALMQVLESARREVRATRKECDAALKKYIDTDETHRALLRRMERQRDLLGSLTAKYAVDSLLKSAYLSDILAQCCDMLSLQETSVWLFTNDRDMLRCVSHVNEERRIDRTDETLRRKDHHLFFMSLEFESLIAARDIVQDPRTRSLAASKETGSGSLLAAPLFGPRGLVGAVLFESNQSGRHWQADEEMFLLTLSHFMGQHLPEQADKPGVGRVLHVYDASRAEPARVVRLPAIEEFREAPQYRMFLESLGAIVWAVDKEGKFIMLNPVAEDAYGFDLGGLLGSPLFNFVSATAGNADRHALQAILQGDEYRVYETRHLTRTGNVLPLRITLTALQDESGEIIGAIGVAQDLSGASIHPETSAANQD